MAAASGRMSGTRITANTLAVPGDDTNGVVLDIMDDRTTSPSPHRPPNAMDAKESLKTRATSWKLPSSGQPQSSENQTRIDASQLQTVKKLGEGAFATVEQCKYTPAGGQTRMVAVKKLKPAIVSNQSDLDCFMSEIAVMRKLRHPNIVEYIGYGSSDRSSPSNSDSSLFLVSELMEGGTLKKLVMKQMKEPHKNVYTHHDAMRWCIQIAEALAYLHDCTPMVIHRDLKLENVLLKGSNPLTQDAKLSDFGLVAFVQRRTQGSRPIGRAISSGLGYSTSGDMNAAPVSDRISAEQERWTRNSKALIARMSMANKPRASILRVSMTALPEPSLAQGAVKQLSGRTGTFMYMAPEMFLNKEYNEKVDVFSFGVIMCELFHRYMMVFAVSNQGTEEEIEQYAERVASGWRPPLNERFPAPLLSVIKAAWAQNPRDRPSMSEVAKRLRQLRDEGVLSGVAEQNDACCVIS